METFSLNPKDDGTLHIEGLPDAVKAITIEGPIPRRLADLTLHRGDLMFAADCLKEVSGTSNSTIRLALWRSAIVHFMKCFGSSAARSALDATVILRKHEPTAMQAFEYVKNMRNKHVVHDENPYSQAVPMAAINNGNKSYKVEKILCAEHTVIDLDQTNFNNLQMLIALALDWVADQADLCCNLITKELEKETIENLLGRMNALYIAPTIDEVGLNRLERGAPPR